MKILLVGSLSWNPERIRSLYEQGHELWGVWARSMAWDQGPYPMLDGCVRELTIEDAAHAIRSEGIECVYSLFQSYRPWLWGPVAPGIEHDVWTLLRHLLAERQRGAIDVPIVRHWGFDVHDLDPDVVRALDGNLFCNRQKLAYWSTPLTGGGCGLDVFDGCEVREFLDSDRPKLEFMNDDFAERLSDSDGELHTVCAGRPFNIDYLAAARHGIHVHVYGNSYDDTVRTIARDVPTRLSRDDRRLLRRFVHIHGSMQTVGATWAETQRVKSRWVSELSRYDAAWSYIGSPLQWQELDARASLPNRVSTYLLAGLPMITDRLPGYYRYEELHRLGVEIELGSYEGLRFRLEAEAATRELSGRARAERAGYSFEATIGTLIATLEEAIKRYFSRPREDRIRFAPTDGQLVEIPPEPEPRGGPVVRRLRGLVGAVRSRQLIESRRMRRLGQILE